MSAVDEDEDGFVVASPMFDKGENSDSSSEEEDEEDSSPKKRFDKIINSLKDSDVTDTGHEYRDPSRLEVFAVQNPWLADKTAGDGEHSNLLHLLVEEARDKYFEIFSPLITVLLKKYPKLLRDQDSNLKTPLYIAISRKREKVVRLMCAMEKDIDSVFRISCYQANCLHIAIKRNVAPKLLTFLIRIASEDTLRAKDDKGKTPLHLAVEYNQCTATQLDIVKELLNKCKGALDERTNPPNSFSAYRLHEDSRETARRVAEAEQKAKEREKEATQAVDNSTKPKTSVKHDPKATMTMKGSAPPGGAAASGVEPEKNQKEFSMRRTNTGLRGLSQKLALAVPGGAGASSSNDNKSAATVVEKKKSSRTKSKTEIKVTEESANQIRYFLKLYCLRELTEDAAVDFLYGKSQESQIYFDLFNTTHLSISEERIENGLAHLKFEEILQYVALPSLHVERLPPSKHIKKREPDGLGRKDMEFLFKFLRDKKVKKVLRVIVDDKQEPSHSDESIEACLGGLGVETWDWRRYDVSIDTVLTAAPDVRDLSLYWGGNNAILRGWSEPEGLPRLVKLERIKLYVKQGLETNARTMANINRFTTRLATLRPGLPIKVIKENQDFKNESITGAQDPSQPPPEPGHRWLECMDQFADFIQNVDPPQQIQDPITIALIDDGVDVNEQSLHAKVVGGRSFYMRDPFQGLSMPYYVTSGGHGTIMANLICRVCPNAQLYVVKLDEGLGENQKRQIRALSAAKAIRAAIAKGVQIISMSWSIEMTTSNSGDIPALEAAIEEAAKAGILMFCAANDQGIARDRSFPSASNTKHIFRIGAAEASGVMWKWAGDPNDVDFIFPGHNVVKDRPNNTTLEGCKTLTGSSVATAVASGFAALILYCVQLSALSTLASRIGGDATTMKDFEAIKGYERMKEAFSAIGTSPSSSSKYVEVWNVFEAAAKKAESASREGKLNILNDIARRLRTTKKYN